MSVCLTCDLADVRAKPGHRNLGHRQLGSNINQMECSDCGRKWKTINRYVWWPVRLKWSRPLPGVKHRFFGWHGFQVGWYDIDARLFAQVFYVGRLRIILGREPK